LLLQPDGKIVLGGFVAGPAGAGLDVALARFTAAGAPDPGFGTGGKVVRDVAGRDDLINGLALQDDGKVVAAGTTDAGGGKFDVLLVRFLADGTPDATFDGDGIVTTDLGGPGDIVYGVAVQPDDKIVAGGQNSADMTVLRYSPGGGPDAGFGSGG